MFAAAKMMFVRLGSRLPVIWSGGSTVDAFWSRQENWTELSIPQNGDTLTFAGLIRSSPVNDISDLALKGITFAAGGASFNLSGLPFTLHSGAFINTEAAGKIHTIANPITLEGTLAINCTEVDSLGRSLTLSGGITGGASGSLVKNGSGLLFLNSANDYAGGTTVNAGTLKILNKNSLWMGLLTLNANATLDLNGSNLENGSGTSAHIASAVGSRIINSGNPFLTGSSARGTYFSPSLGTTGLMTFNAQIDDSAGNLISVRFGHSNGSITLTHANHKIRGTVVLTSAITTVSNLAYGSFGAGDLLVGNSNATPELKYVGTADSNFNDPTVGAAKRDILLNNGTSMGTGGGMILENNGTGKLTMGGVYATDNSSAKLLTLGGSNTLDNTMTGDIRNAATMGVVSVKKTGTGKWRLTGVNTYTGLTTIDGGTLVSVVLCATRTTTLATGNFTKLAGLTVTFAGAAVQVNDTFRFFPGAFSQGYTGTALKLPTGYAGSFSQSLSTLTITAVP